jgi:myosin heavy subunit
MELIERLETVEPELRAVLWAILKEIESQREATVTRTDFAEMHQTVADLLRAQSATWEQIHALTEAQRETEKQIQALNQSSQRLDQRMEQRAQADQQRQEEFKQYREEQAQAERQRQQELEQHREELKQYREEQAQAEQRRDERFEQYREEQAQAARQRQEEFKRYREERAEAERRLDQRMEELSQARRESERSRKNMLEAIESLARTAERISAELARSMKGLDTRLGGVTRSQAYALENDAYRFLPAFLAERGIEVTDKFIRTEVAGVEINLLAHARRQGEEILVVGESVTRLDDRSKFAQLDKQVRLARDYYKCPVMPVLITHFARPRMLELAERENILVVQSFEWV